MAPIFGNFSNVSKLLIAILLVSRVSSEDEHFTAQDVLTVFRLMRNTGNDRLDEEQDNPDSGHVTNTTNQFLVVAVMSQEELVQSRDWTSIPNKVNNRMNVYFNQIIHGCKKKQIGKKPMHGEVQCLYYKNRLDGMIKTFNDENENNDVRPFVVMYSVYIPCAYITGIEYSCAEELGMDALIHYNTYRMLVGFEKLFDNTDSSSATRMLCEGGIDVYQLTGNDVITSYMIGSMTLDKLNDVHLFQIRLLESLKLSPIQQCTENCIHIDLTENFLKSYVDALTFYCTKNNDDLRGPFTELKRQAFLNRAKDFIEDRTDASCGKNSIATKLWLEYCVIQALESSTVIGEQTQSLDDRWKRPNLNSQWESLYHSDPEIRFPKAYCSQNVIGFCSRKKGEERGRFLDRGLVRVQEKAKQAQKRKPK